MNVCLLFALFLLASGFCTAGPLEILTPAPGTIIRYGETVTITWRGADERDPVTVAVTRDGERWDTIARRHFGNSLDWRATGRGTDRLEFRVSAAPRDSTMLVLPHPVAVSTAAFSPDGGLVVTSAYDCVIRIWDAVSGTLLHSTPIDHATAPVPGDPYLRPWAVFSPNGSVIAASCSYDEENRASASLLAPATGAIVHTLEGLKSPLAFSHDGRYLAGGDRIADAFELRMIDAILTPHYPASAVRFSSIGPMTSSCTADELVAHDAATGEETERVRLTVANGIRSFALFSGDSMVIARDGDNVVHVRAIDDGAEKWRRRIAPGIGAGCPDADIQVSPDERLAAVGDAAGNLMLLDMDDGATRRLLRPHRSAVAAAGFSADGRRVVTAGHDSAAVIVTIFGADVAATSAPLQMLSPAIRVELDADTVRQVVGRPEPATISGSITNEGSVALRIDDFGFLVADRPTFDVTSARPTGRVIEPGASIPFALGFRPADTGAFEATLILRVDGSLIETPVTGIGIEPRVAPRVRSIDFGEVSAGSSNDTVIAGVIRNIDTVPHRVRASIIEGADAFTIVEGGEEVFLAPNEELDIIVRFTPVDRRDVHSGVLGFSYELDESPTRIALRGSVPEFSSVALETGSRLVAFPNPVADLITVVFPSNVDAMSLELVDALGRSVLRRSFEERAIGARTLDVSGIREGSYFLVITSDARRVVRPIVVSRGGR